MNIVEAAQTAYKDIAAPDVSAYYSDYINSWRNVFEGSPPWKTTSKNTLSKQGVRTLNMLNVGKVLSDYFSDLTFSEQVDVSISDDRIKEYVDNVLNVCGFWRNIPELLANAYALGGCAVKVFAAAGKPCIDFVHADKFIPLSWAGKDITDGVFMQQSYKNKSYYTLLERQSKGKTEFKLFKSTSKSDLGVPCPLAELYPELADTVTYEGVDVPMFAYFKPSVSNNAEYDTPLGMSVYANSLDTLKALDTVFDSFCREVVLGKKRIIVPTSSVKAVTDDETGNQIRYFDANDEVFVALNAEDAGNLKITDDTTTLRIDEHVAAINAQLNILCFQVGLSSGSLSFDAVQGVKTATEVMSQDSKTMRTIKSNKNLFTETLETLIHAIIALGVSLGDIKKTDYELSIGWQDNVVIDDNTLIDNTIKLYSAGLIDLKTAVMRVNKCDEATAAKMIEDINSGSAVGSADFFGADGGQEE